MASTFCSEGVLLGKPEATGFKAKNCLRQITNSDVQISGKYPALNKMDSVQWAGGHLMLGGQLASVLDWAKYQVKSRCCHRVTGESMKEIIAFDSKISLPLALSASRGRSDEALRQTAANIVFGRLVTGIYGLKMNRS